VHVCRRILVVAFARVLFLGDFWGKSVLDLVFHELGICWFGGWF
jgi:hypothetical protein